MRVLPVALAVGVMASNVWAQESFGRRNTFTVFGEFSNDSSHIILGSTPNRKLAGVGVQYERSLLRGRFATLAYMAEFRPFIVSSDPVAATHATGSVTMGGVSYPISFDDSQVVFACYPGTVMFSGSALGESFSETQVTTCSREKTLAQGGSPIGLRVNLRPGRRLQVTLSSNGGYMYATKPIPIPTAGSFNFTFNFGGGLEFYTSARRSVRLEYLVQHYSNHSTAMDNPGVDSGFVRLAYAFGR